MKQLLLSLLVFAALANPAEAALTDNLIEHWSLDSTRNGSSGAINLSSGGGSYEAGVINNGVRYNGLFDSFSYNTAINAGTISFWFNRKGNGSGGSWRLFAKTQTSVTDVVNIAADNQGKRFRLTLQDTTIFQDGSDRFADNTNYMLTVTWNGTTVKGYVNCVEVYSVSSNKVIAANSQSYTIGGWSGNGTENANAVIDEPLISSRAWSGSEICQLYNGGAGLPYPFVIPTVAVEDIIWF